MQRFLILVIFVIFCGLLSAQSKKRPQPERDKLKKIEEAINKQEWNVAKSLSDKLVKQYPESPEAWKVYAGVYKGVGDILSSEKALQRIIQLDSIGYPDAYRWIAEWSFNRGGYQDAFKNISRYFEIVHDSAGLPYRIKLLSSSIRFALEQVKKSEVNQPKKLAGSINTADDEYFPSLSVDGSVLAFTRQPKEGPGRDMTGKIQEDLYFAVLKDSVYGKAEPFPSPVNTTGNEGTQSLSQDGRIMFFTGCNRKDTKGGCDLYYCVKTGNNWSDPVNLGYPLNSRYWESTPFLAADGKHLFFSSNRPGGFGGMDIWFSVLKNDSSWSVPVNLGAPVNTPGDELAPFLLVDGRTLFFASNGQIGMGGFDLYRYDLAQSDKLQIPFNLGYRVNTFYDEDALTVNSELNMGLFASNRDSLTGKDIYEVDMSQYIPVNKTLTITGYATDRITGRAIGAKIELQPHGDTLISSVEADPSTGLYLLGIPLKPSYRIGASCPGYLPYSFYYIYDTLSGNRRIQHAIAMEPIKLGAAIVLQNIFFSFDSYELLPESSRDLDEILMIFKQNPGIQIEICGYTDNTGTDQYNLGLSQKRSESVKKFLLEHGVNPIQITARGFGSANPRASNESEDGRRSNRRTEIKIIRIN
jgi:flagellar motor protein MotB